MLTTLDTKLSDVILGLCMLGR